MPSSSKTVVAVNGFLGRESDWSLIPNLLAPEWELKTIDLWNQTEIASYDLWAKKTSEQIANGFPKQKKILLGYSMGGRLALHLLIAAPHLFDGAVIVSANPGLVSTEDRSLRLKADEVWATKFMREEWSTLMNDWNEQSVLKTPERLSADAIVLNRNEGDFRRLALAQALRRWSLGEQRNLRKELSELAMPIQFITGESDLKFSAIAHELAGITSAGPREHVAISGAGHRVPWDAPSQFRAALAQFLARW